MKHTISYGLDGTDGKPIATADDLCDALVQIERLLGGRDVFERIPVVNRGNETMLFPFIHNGKSAWVKTQKEKRLPHASQLDPFFDVGIPREGLVYV